MKTFSYFIKKRTTKGPAKGWLKLFNQAVDLLPPRSDRQPFYYLVVRFYAVLTISPVHPAPSGF